MRQFVENCGFQAGLWRQGRLIGALGVHGYDWQSRRTSLGYWLGSEHTGQGFMTMACASVIDHLLGELKLNRVEIRCAPENLKSRAIPERLGFRQEGRIRQAEWVNTRYVDHVVYGILAGEWKSR